MDIVFPPSKQQQNSCMCVCVSAKTNTDINKQKRQRKKEIREDNKTRHVLQIVNNAKTTRILATETVLRWGGGEQAGERASRYNKQTTTTVAKSRQNKMYGFFVLSLQERERERELDREPPNRELFSKHIFITFSWNGENKRNNVKMLRVMVGRLKLCK